MEQETQALLENGVENIADAPPYPEEKPAPPNDTRTEVGYLVVSAGSGGKAYPLADVQVEIYLQEDDGSWRLYRRTATAASGTAEKIEVPTPKAPVDMDESNPFAPYTLARVRAFRDGYYPIEAKEVPIFSGITSLQYFELIPLSESAALAPPTGTLTIVGENSNSTIDEYAKSDPAISNDTE